MSNIPTPDFSKTRWHLATPMTVLLCVVQWLDGDIVRLSVAGWDGCPHQRHLMQEQALGNIQPEFVQSIRFVELCMEVDDD